MNTFDVLRHYLGYRFRGFRNRESLLAWQQKKIDNHLKWVVANSPYYKDMAGKPLSEWPLMNKSTMMANFDQLNTVGIKADEAFDFANQSEHSRDFSQTLNGVTVGLSTGTSGKRGIFLASDKERALWAGAILGKLVPDLLWKSHRVALFLRADSTLYSSVNSKRLAFQFFDMITDVKEHIQALNTFKPDIIIAPGSILKRIAKRADELTFRPSRLIACAEVLYHDTEGAIDRAFGLHVEQIYQCTEGFLGCTQNGVFSFNEDLVHVEPQWLDEEKTRFRPIITDFRRTSQPIIRYVLDDIIQYTGDGHGAFMPIGRIEGRCDDILTATTTDGHKVEIYPDFIVRSVMFSTPVDTFRIIQTADDVLTVECDPEFHRSITESLEMFFEKRGFVLPSILCKGYDVDLLRKNRRVLNLCAQ